MANKNIWRRQPSNRLSSQSLIQYNKEEIYTIANNFFEPHAVTQAILKTWDGSFWVSGRILKTWDGINETVKPLKIWNGTTWIIAN